ncbi:MAG: hypothetical protein M1825_006016 [Sarcosagium campestre]|nr:MAG: hypothetical protein M1825_006016 [Sarcosagium campestre]
MLRRDDDNIYGIVSSHAAACLAAANAYGRGINDVKPTFIHDFGEAITKASPIDYIKDAKLRGSLFDPEVTDGTISCVDTGFFVDHSEPLEALKIVREDTSWPLGDLIDVSGAISSIGPLEGPVVLEKPKGFRQPCGHLKEDHPWRSFTGGIAARAGNIAYISITLDHDGKHKAKYTDSTGQAATKNLILFYDGFNEVKTVKNLAESTMDLQQQWEMTRQEQLKKYDR